ncbi:hypothetical protein GCM10010326_00500 [Streptomyces xanthochromogenes]|uniref:Secreted protein n=1 Tax=Streptomyces xanthochromogenes TaxID=67384 RepID=A0ABQ2ZG72_9ACTN|nr:hypothetical protein GCM10010326_00500 [Streptomyces xanthochromogenes]
MQLRGKQRLVAGVVAAAFVGAVTAGGVTLAQANTAAKAPVSSVQVVVGPESEPGQPSSARCPQGMGAINGGFQAISFYRSNGGDPYDGVTANAPFKDGKGWVAMLLAGKVRARAVCVPEDQAPQAAVGPVSEEDALSVARCPEGTKAIAGGYVRDTWYKNGYGASLDDITVNAPNDSGTGWAAKQFHGKTVARVLCS